MFLTGDPVSGFGLLPIGAQLIRPGSAAAAAMMTEVGGYQIGPFLLSELPALASKPGDPLNAWPDPGTTYVSEEADAEEACTSSGTAWVVGGGGGKDSGGAVPMPTERGGYMMTYSDPSQIPDSLRAHLMKVIYDQTLMHPSLSGGRQASTEFGNYYYLDDPSEVSFWGGLSIQGGDPLDAGNWWKDKGRYPDEATGFDTTKAPWWNQPKLAQSYRSWMDALGIGDRPYNLAMISMAASGVYPWNTFGPLMSGIPIMTYRGPYPGGLTDAGGNPIANPGMSIWDPSKWSALDYPDVWPDASPDPTVPDPTTGLSFNQRPWMEWAVFLRLRSWGTTYDYYKTNAPIFGCSTCYPIPVTPIDSFLVLDVIFMPVRDWYNYQPNACIDVGNVLPKFWLGLGLWVLQNLCTVADSTAVIGALTAIGKGTPGKNPKTGKATPPVPNPYASAAAALLPLVCKAVGPPPGSAPPSPVPTIDTTGPPWGTILIVGGILLAIALVLRGGGE